MRARSLLPVLFCLVSGSTPFLAASALAQATAPSQAPGASDLPLFAVEIKVGPNWDAAKPPPEQRFFKEHSANLRRLRDAQHLVLGARYADKGLVVLAAPSLEDARAMLEPDPSFKAGVFAYELHPFNVFYPGTVQGRARPPAAPK